MAHLITKQTESCIFLLGIEEKALYSAESANEPVALPILWRPNSSRLECCNSLYLGVTQLYSAYTNAKLRLTDCTHCTSHLSLTWTKQDFEVTNVLQFMCKCWSHQVLEQVLFLHSECICQLRLLSRTIGKMHLTWSFQIEWKSNLFGILADDFVASFSPEGCVLNTVAESYPQGTKDSFIRWSFT